VNYLAGYQLTYALLPLLEQGRAPRIVNVSSIAAAPLDFSDVMLTRGYSSNRAYGQSKLAQVMFTIDPAQEPKGKGIVVQALHVIAVPLCHGRCATAQSWGDQRLISDVLSPLRPC
jgi:NAD(P)-dependent dehydrogenase (short-subunit alcohol dehydrogenase family)